MSCCCRTWRWFTVVSSCLHGSLVLKAFRTMLQSCYRLQSRSANNSRWWVFAGFCYLWSLILVTIILSNIFDLIWLLFCIVSCCNTTTLVPGSSGVEDALDNTNPPTSPVLRCLLYLVPFSPCLLKILADDSWWRTCWWRTRWQMRKPLWLSYLSPCPLRKCPWCFAAIYGVLQQQTLLMKLFFRMPRWAEEIIDSLSLLSVWLIFFIYFEPPVLHC